MSRLLAIDAGSSSVKAAVLDGTAIVGGIGRATYGTGGQAARSAEEVWHTLTRAVAEIDAAGATALGVTGMGPAWIALDDAGRPLTPLVTHADRRSLPQAKRIESTVGRERHLALAGNRPTPGGISSTTAAWFAENEPGVLDRAATLGHLPTFLIHKLTGERTIDPSNAGFTGLMDVTTGRWSDELCAVAGVPIGKLPPIADAAEVHGHLTADAAAALGLPAGLPVLGGFVDGSGPILLAGAKVGQLVHSAGSTDVLALCVDRPMPRDGLLCRPLGTRGLWVNAATLSSGGSLVEWVVRRFFGETADIGEAVRRARGSEDGGVRVDPRFGGDRQAVEQPAGGITGLTLNTSPEQILSATLAAIDADRADRLERLRSLGVPLLPNVVRTGGGAGEVAEATLRGLGALL